MMMSNLNHSLGCQDFPNILIKQSLNKHYTTLYKPFEFGFPLADGEEWVDEVGDEVGLISISSPVSFTSVTKGINKIILME